MQRPPRSVTIGRDVAQTFAWWRTLSARAFANFADVTPRPDGSAQWKLRPPLTASWKTETVEESAEGFLRWAAPGPAGRIEGSVAMRPAPGERRTEVALSLTGPVSRPIIGTAG